MRWWMARYGSLVALGLLLVIFAAPLAVVSQVGLDAATDSVLFFPTGGVSFCSGVDRARGSCDEPKVTRPLSFTLLLTLPP